jgi:hypothetical protein
VRACCPRAQSISITLFHGISNCTLSRNYTEMPFDIQGILRYALLDKLV